MRGLALFVSWDFCVKYSLHVGVTSQRGARCCAQGLGEDRPLLRIAHRVVFVRFGGAVACG